MVKHSRRFDFTVEYNNAHDMNIKTIKKSSSSKAGVTLNVNGKNIGGRIRMWFDPFNNKEHIQFIITSGNDKEAQGPKEIVINSFER